jgi:PadR family transcriptional regulator PadR
MGERLHLGSFELIVLLAVIRLRDDAYGVPISREIKERGGRAVTFGSLYATLERLEQKGLIASELGEPTAERGGRAKKYFRATAAGLREVRAAQRALQKLWQDLPQLQARRT